MDAWFSSHRNDSAVFGTVTESVLLFGAAVTNASINIDSDTECRDVHNYNRSLRCTFVKAADACNIEDGLINYTQLIYCGLSPHLVPLALILLAIWLTFLFIAMAVSADDFFCPQLVVISKCLRMSDNIAGVTLMAFGNGAPDVFSALAAIRNSHNGEIGLAVGALVGAGVFVTTMVSGSICIVKPFHMAERPFLRDVIFYMGAIFMTYCVFNDSYISIAECVAFILVYLFYVAVVVIGRYIYQRQRSSRQKAQTDDVTDSNPGINHDGVIFQNASSLPENTWSINAGGRIQNASSFPDNTWSINDGDMATHTSFDHNQSMEQGGPNDVSINSDTEDLSEMTPLIRRAANADALKSPLKQILKSITPINIEQFRDSRWFGKTYQIFKAPALFILTLAIPVTDFDRPRNGWERYLNALHCVIAPLLTLAVTNPQYFVYKLGGVFPVYGFILILGTILAAVVLITSTNAQPPRYHIIYAFVGFVGSVLWIEAIASEIVNILTTLGIVFKASSAILGLTLLAWGNSIADYIADIAMAKNGFPRAGFSACYGGPLFSIGVPFTTLCAANGSRVSIQFTLMQAVLLFSLLLNLVVTLIAVPALKFNLGRAFGIYLIIFYVLFMVFVVITELGLLGDPTNPWSF